MAQLNSTHGSHAPFPQEGAAKSGLSGVHVIVLQSNPNGHDADRVRATCSRNTVGRYIYIYWGGNIKQIKTTHTVVKFCLNN